MPKPSQAAWLGEDAQESVLCNQTSYKEIEAKSSCQMRDRDRATLVRHAEAARA